MPIFLEDLLPSQTNTPLWRLFLSHLLLWISLTSFMKLVWLWFFVFVRLAMTMLLFSTIRRPSLVTKVFILGELFEPSLITFFIRHFLFRLWLGLPMTFWIAFFLPRFPIFFVRNNLLRFCFFRQFAVVLVEFCRKRKGKRVSRIEFRTDEVGLQIGGMTMVSECCRCYLL